MSSTNAIERTLEFIECINKGNLSSLEAMLTQDHTFIDGSGEVHAGRSLMVEGWRSYLHDFPDYLIHVCELFLQAPRVIVVGRTTGSHTGQPRAEEILETLIWEAEISGNQVKRWKIFDDTPVVRKRLGADADSRITLDPQRPSMKKA